MGGREAGRFTTIRDFGAIGNGLAYAIGVAVAKPDSSIVVFEGDGGLLMHIQELETIRRHGLKLLICVLNDGGFGAEIHVLRAHNLDASIAMFGREDFARIASGFSLNGADVGDLDEIPKLLREFQDSDRAAVWNFPLSDKIKWSMLPIHAMD
jgi:thiamine pyrophosphate-dependent acetolactate synthase large subunit-like protein